MSSKGKLIAGIVLVTTAVVAALKLQRGINASE